MPSIRGRDIRAAIALSLATACGQTSGGAPCEPRTCDGGTESPAVEAAGPGEGSVAAPLVVDGDWLAGRLGDGHTVPLYVHGADTFAAGHIPGSAQLDAARLSTSRGAIPNEAVDAVTFAGLLAAAGVDRDATVVVYEDDLTWDGPRVLWTLEYFGHPDVRFLDGGLVAWKGDGRALETGPPGRPAAAYAEPAPRADRIADAPWVLAHLGDPAVRLVDARTASEYAAGHIPGARNVDWTVLRDGGRFAAAAALAAAFSAVGVEASASVVTYCQSGYRGAVDYLALRQLGYADVRLYDGSWAEWGARMDLPKEK